MAQINTNINTEDTTYSRCEESKNILDGNDPNVVCMIRRKKASNLVVYRVNTEVNLQDNKNNEENKAGDTQSVSINCKQPIDIFWLKLSKQDLKSHRESGKMDDRVEITKIERKLAYGVTCKKITNKKNTNKKNTKKSRARWRSSKSKKSKSSTDTTNTSNITTNTNKNTYTNDAVNNIDTSSFAVRFCALKSMAMILRIDPNDHKPYLFGNIMIEGNLVECKLREIWVTMKKGTFGVQKIDYLTIKATRCDNNHSIEHIMKKKQKH